MTDGEIHARTERSASEHTLTYLFVIVLAAQVVGLLIVHTYILVHVDGPSTFDTLRTVWIGGAVMTGLVLVIELLS